MMKKLCRRLRSNRGESVVESLFAIVVAALTAVVLAGAVISAARVNAGADQIVTFPEYESTTSATKECTLSGKVKETMYNETFNVTLYKEDQGDMIYYENE